MDYESKIKCTLKFKINSSDLLEIYNNGQNLKVSSQGNLDNQQSFDKVIPLQELKHLTSIIYHTKDPDLFATCIDTDIHLFKLDEDNHLKSDSFNSNFKHSFSFINKHLYSINQIKFNNAGNLICSAGNDSSINIFDLERQCLNRNIRIQEPESIVTCMDINYTSNLVLCGIYDKLLILYDVRQKKPAFKIMAHSEPITSVSFSDDSTNFCSTSYDAFCRIWEIFKGHCLKSLMLEKGPPISKAMILPDREHVIVSSLNNRIQILDYNNEAEFCRYEGHTNEKMLVDYEIFNRHYSPYLISGSEDGCVYIWDMIDEKLDKKVEFNNSNCSMEVDKDNDLNNKKAFINSLSVNCDEESFICSNGESVEIYQIENHKR